VVKEAPRKIADEMVRRASGVKSFGKWAYRQFCLKARALVEINPGPDGVLIKRDAVANYDASLDKKVRLTY
jgi:hypothetical protein